MNRLPLTLLASTAMLIAATACLAAANDPYMVEARVQTDLESAVGRLITREQFLVQVTGEVTMRSERRLVEGETVVNSIEQQAEITVAPMPGFVPETESPDPQRNPIQNRQMFRMVDMPELSAVRVRASFDDKLPAVTITRAKEIITGYLRSNYPNRSYVSFSLIPMLKIEKPEEKKTDKADDKPKEPVPKPEEKDQWFNERWALWGMLGVLLLLLLQKNRRADAPASAGQSAPALNFGGLADVLGAARQGGGSPTNATAANSTPTPSSVNRRKKLLDKFLSRSDAFRQYYDRLTNEEREEMYSALKGPAYHSLLETIGFRRPMESELDANSLAEKVLEHEKNFDEFVQAQDWQERQFFGFLQQMTSEQLINLIRTQDARTACVMLRLMRPAQSASILDMLSGAQRRQVLSHTQEVVQIPVEDLEEMEKKVRTIAHRVPSGIFASNKNETEFWGTVLAESHKQEDLFQDMEKTNPGITPNLKKYKFRLEDAATLPDNLLGKVLGNVDNEELCLALATCNEDVAEVILDALSPARRNIIKKQMDSYRGAAKDQAEQARLSLTRKFREVLA